MEKIKFIATNAGKGKHLIPGMVYYDSLEIFNNLEGKKLVKKLPNGDDKEVGKIYEVPKK